VILDLHHQAFYGAQKKKNSPGLRGQIEGRERSVTFQRLASLEVLAWPQSVVQSVESTMGGPGQGDPVRSGVCGASTALCLKHCHSSLPG
jgi:hypothetical protein